MTSSKRTSGTRRILPEVEGVQPKPYSFDCAHCGQHLEGDYLPKLCPSCGKRYCHEIGGTEPLRFTRKEIWKRCAEHGCWYYIKVDDYPKIYQDATKAPWRRLRAPNKKNHVSGKREGTKREGKRRRKR